MKQVSYIYCFVRDQPRSESAKILVSNDRAARLVSAHVVPMKGVNGIHPAPDIHEHFTIHKGYGTLRISSRTTSTILSTL